MRKYSNKLPIDDLRSELINCLQANNRLIVTAETGSGKSTRLPQFLLDDYDFQGKILILQPRRLATMMLGQRVAEERESVLGEEIGCQTRYETKVGKKTKLQFITDGLLLRFIQKDPLLSDVSVVIFDEFHERSLASDLGLAMLTILQQTRPELKIIVMSATLDISLLANYLQNAAILTSKGRVFPVATQYLSMPNQVKIWDKASDLARDYCTTNHDGNILIFMPGAGEIQRTITACEKWADQEIKVLPLFSELSVDKQKEVMAKDGIRKIIVATNIAETSLTIPNIRLVIDSGLARIGRYDAMRGVSSIFLEKISLSSANQRTGRAGREAEGKCIRMWTKDEQKQLVNEILPEICRVDLSQVLLLLATIGITDFYNFPWLQAPEKVAIAKGLELLKKLSALDENNEITKYGQELSVLSLPPRLGSFVMSAKKSGQTYPALLTCALLTELNSLSNLYADLKFAHGKAKNASELLDIIHHFYDGQRLTATQLQKKGVSSAIAFRIERTINQYAKQLNEDIKIQHLHEVSFLKSLLVAFSDHLIFQRDNGEYEMATGQRGMVNKNSLFTQSLLLSLENYQIGDSQNNKLRFSMLSSIKKEWLEELFAAQRINICEMIWSDNVNGVLRRKRELICGVVVAEQIDTPPPEESVTEIFVQRIKDGKLILPNWDNKVLPWIERVRWLAQLFPEKQLLIYDETDLELIYSEICDGITREKHLKDIDILTIVKGALSWDDQQFVERHAPEKIKLPTGRPLKITYCSNATAKGSAKIQDLYDLPTLPILAEGRGRLLLDILAPNFRTVQITDDLERFWQEHYPKLKKELSRRYPKHQWR